MSYSHRDQAQARLKRAHAALEKALDYCAVVALDYKEHTPKVAEALEPIASVISVAQQGIQDVRGMF